MMMNKPSPDKHHILTVQGESETRGFEAAFTGTGSVHCVKFHSSLKEKSKQMCRAGSESRNNESIPKCNGNPSVPMPSVKPSPRLWDRDRGRTWRWLCWWAGAFQTQLLGTGAHG